MIYSMFHEDSQSAQITNTHNKMTAML